jgi:hypothetical protein
VGGLVTVLTLPIYGRLRALREPADRITSNEEGKIPPSPALAEAEGPTHI